MKRRPKSGGGWPAIRYTFRMAQKAGWLKLWQAMSSKNACKTCALGMGGQSGGMRNEAGHWPEVCKKSLQAMVADMQDGIRAEFFERYSIAQLRTLSPREMESAGRLVQPIYAAKGKSHYRVIDWTEANRRIGESLRAAHPDETFFYFSGRSSNEASFLLQLFARVYGTNNVNNCSYYCHQASGVGLTESLGTGTATLTLEDVEHADLFFLIGGNPASNHPRLMRSLMTVRRNGGKVIVINPVVETGLVNFRVPSDIRSLFFGTEIASQYVQPHIGGDIALMTGIAKVLLERGSIDRAFIEKATEGFEAFAAQVSATGWPEIEERSGVTQSEIVAMAETYQRAKKVVFGWTMGITHHEHGVENVQMIVNLALLRGMIGKPHAGVLPIRGHSNVQGIGSMGVTPVLKQAIFSGIEKHLDVRLPTTPGLDTMGCMQAADQGKIQTPCLRAKLSPRWRLSSI
jgi:molybdopterin-dependent oxidoreductase alpha subunit